MDLAGPKCRTGQILAEEGFRLSPGARLLLRRAAPDPAMAFPAQAECTLPALVDALEVGQPVLIDDGKTSCEVEEVRPEGVVLRVSHGRESGRKLREGKSLNAPRSAIRERAVTDKDVCDIEFVARHADAVQLSFVQERSDVGKLQHELERHLGGRPMLPVVLKIETARAVRAFPELVAQAGAKQPVAAMIARGDLAVEIGFERLAEMQEELLCLAEAAHVPVIWATQVLERFVRKGLPTRAEISDVVLGGRAECVMLNKGPYQLEAVSILHDLLLRLQGHQWKRRPQLRALRSWA
ncbi:MAG: pyruvate kinase, partial [Sandaracinaceae bacterium]|nr:pyruvate kinase [Sandaracinaceae bacterium]